MTLDIYAFDAGAVDGPRYYGSPDLILFNHRLNLNEEAEKHATTFLWEGAETYIDVHMSNKMTATHNPLRGPSHRFARSSRLLTRQPMGESPKPPGYRLYLLFPSGRIHGG